MDTESQFLPDGIFKHRRRSYAKMGRLKRKADASTHIPHPPGAIWPRLLFRYLGQVQKGHPIYKPTSPLHCSSSHCRSTLPTRPSTSHSSVLNPNTLAGSLPSPCPGATAGKGPPPPAAVPSPPCHQHPSSATDAASSQQGLGGSG